MIPTTEIAKRIATLFRRRLETNWSDKEVRRYKQLVKDGCLSAEGLDLIERYYVYQRKQEKGIHRRDLFTFLNNFAGELDRAQAWDEEQREKLKRKVRQPRDPEYSGDCTSDEDWKRISDLARAEMLRFKNQYA